MLIKLFKYDFTALGRLLAPISGVLLILSAALGFNLRGEFNLENWTMIPIILGVLLVISGFSCMFTPLKTFFSTGYFLGIILLVYGIAGILRIISKKEKADVLEWVMHILSIIIGLIALFRPGTTLVFDAMLLTIIAGAIPSRMAARKDPVVALRTE